MHTLKGRVFDQLGAVSASLSSFSISACETGVTAKSLVDLRAARKSEKALSDFDNDASWAMVRVFRIL
jgi:hypothetical protein